MTCPNINEIAVPIALPIPEYFLAKGILIIILKNAIIKKIIVLYLYLFFACNIFNPTF
ncbi:hypothetical protein D3C72_1877930 [compost metagenome]